MGFQSAFNRSFSTIAGAAIGTQAITALKGENKKLAAENVKLAASERAAKVANLQLGDEFKRHIASTKEGRKVLMANRLGNINEDLKATDVTKLTKDLRAAETEEMNDGNS